MKGEFERGIKQINREASLGEKRISNRESTVLAMRQRNERA